MYSSNRLTSPLFFRFIQIVPRIPLPHFCNFLSISRSQDRTYLNKTRTHWLLWYASKSWYVGVYEARLNKQQGSQVRAQCQPGSVAPVPRSFGMPFCITILIDLHETKEYATVTHTTLLEKRNFTPNCSWHKLSSVDELSTVPRSHA